MYVPFEAILQVLHIYMYNSMICTTGANIYMYNYTLSMRP